MPPPFLVQYQIHHRTLLFRESVRIRNRTQAIAAIGLAPGVEERSAVRAVPFPEGNAQPGVKRGEFRFHPPRRFPINFKNRFSHTACDESPWLFVPLHLCNYFLICVDKKGNYFRSINLEFTGTFIRITSSALLEFCLS